VGRANPTSERSRKTRRRALRLLTCLRKGCNRRFLPGSWNHRYCRDPDCAREVRRWQARKRQERRRSTEAGKAAHREAEKRRRAALPERREAARRQGAEGSATGPRGHAAPGGKICDRPGCFAPPAEAVNGQARYCRAGCRQAVRRVLDRERKWFSRQTPAGIFKRRLEYARRRAGAPVKRLSPGADPPRRE